MSATEPAPADRRPLRVASYNLRDLRDDSRAAARIVRAIDPDVLCLQEVPRRLLGSWRVALFAAQGRMYWSGRHQGSGGTTILTSLRVDTRSVRHLPLPVRFGQRPRGYAVARVRTLGGGVPVEELTVVSVHLGLEPAERLAQLRQILANLPDAGPVVVAGDLNEGPDGAAWQLLAERCLVVSPDLPTYPAGDPQRRIDAIFASASGAVTTGEPVGLGEADVRSASDHRPVWVDLAVT